ncbi:alpha/beta hydrolase [Streptomyces sp. DK15]|uniref:alpha/beta hydrolase family protein n=1 Tax=Streptomyces sp. DK15 TaxID=2957499 RepID=UPI0029AF525C|nr:alpha/beta fold hydrolase [Streptomyces sp. DK15]MDX2389277.1 alpha/beta hydrolase [Streptomyces sp. DK15]
MTLPGRQQPLIRVLYDESRRDLRAPDRPRPLRLHLWEPDRPCVAPAPLVFVSHGTGGSGGEMRWLVRPLREAGFRVAALDHHGNNFVDGYEPEGFLHVWERPRDVSFALDALDREQPLGPVGAAGFSLGGYTAAALAGARVDPGVLWAVLTGEVPFPEIPEFPGVLEELRKTFPPGAGGRGGGPLGQPGARGVPGGPGRRRSGDPGIPGDRPGAGDHPVGRGGHDHPVRERHPPVPGAHPHGPRSLGRPRGPPRRLLRTGTGRPAGPRTGRRGGGRPSSWNTW